MLCGLKLGEVSFRSCDSCVKNAGRRPRIGGGLRELRGCANSQKIHLFVRCDNGFGIVVQSLARWKSNQQALGTNRVPLEESQATRQSSSRNTNGHRFQVFGSLNPGRSSEKTGAAGSTTQVSNTEIRVAASGSARTGDTGARKELRSFGRGSIGTLGWEVGRARRPSTVVGWASRPNEPLQNPLQVPAGVPVPGWTTVYPVIFTTAHCTRHRDTFGAIRQAICAGTSCTSPSSLSAIQPRPCTPNLAIEHSCSAESPSYNRLLRVILYPARLPAPALPRGAPAADALAASPGATMAVKDETACVSPAGRLTIGMPPC